jgi:hypothetical protein
MNPEEYNNLDDLLNAAEKEQQELLKLQDNLSKVISETILKHFPKITSIAPQNMSKLGDLAINAGVRITHDVQDLLNEDK